mmetsp:Transcript_4720/g.11008  ORF Transcript_4720/g.11008 Transcript_4720/m.11008 type:complete len:656 (+) Transcript_4720:113-2080(+)|eukprot:CAMPEP_0170628580 /NCGR_PEP_ID=MMETSP0224-20130122/32775_1 /TAXON_ID=285029 /ORGANISM="Togula jolla, Strain CCCM 725" /LENGTH=655 /DNA_ID=CAMNT_0010956045 /DNA_START=55 /DNA_END=2022 /DNA_ORIENTATION=+
MSDDNLAQLAAAWAAGAAAATAGFQQDPRRGYAFPPQLEQSGMGGGGVAFLGEQPSMLDGASPAWQSWLQGASAPSAPWHRGVAAENNGMPYSGYGEWGCPPGALSPWQPHWAPGRAWPPWLPEGAGNGGGGPAAPTATNSADSRLQAPWAAQGQDGGCQSELSVLAATWDYSVDTQEVSAPQVLNVGGSTREVSSPSTYEKNSTDPVEGDALHFDITSAVQSFLAGEDLEEEDEEDDLPDGPNESALSLGAAATVAPSRATGELQPRSPVQAAATSSSPKSQASRGPTTAGIQDFLAVLRRRPLPPKVTEEVRLRLEKQINTCLLSLYRDRILPSQGQVQRLLRESKCEEAALQALLPICARLPELYHILPPMNGEQPVILLVQEPPWFEGWVDVEAAEGNYAPEVWQALAALLRDDDFTLPAHPYLAAAELRRRNPPHLRCLTSGELEHVVRLALGRRILCHHGDFLRPARVVRAMEAHRGRAGSAALSPLEASTEPVGAKSNSQARNVSLAAAMQPPGQEKKGSSLAGVAQRLPSGGIAEKDELAVVLQELLTQFPNGTSISRMKEHLQVAQRHRSLNDALFTSSKLAESFKSIVEHNWTVPQKSIVKMQPSHKAILPHMLQNGYSHSRGGNMADIWNGWAPSSALIAGDEA